MSQPELPEPQDSDIKLPKKEPSHFPNGTVESHLVDPDKTYLDLTESLCDSDSDSRDLADRYDSPNDKVLVLSSGEDDEWIATDQYLDYEYVDTTREREHR